MSITHQVELRNTTELHRERDDGRTPQLPENKGGLVRLFLKRPWTHPICCSSWVEGTLKVDLPFRVREPAHRGY